MLERAHTPWPLASKLSRQGWSALGRALATVSIATIVVSCGNRTSAVEDIKLRDGTIQRIQLLSTRGPDYLGFRADTDKVEVSFERNQRRYHWQLKRLPGQDWVST